MGRGSDVASATRLPVFPIRENRNHGFWLIVSPPDAKWKAPYSARFHSGASAPGG